MDNRQKRTPTAEDNEILAEPSNPDKKLWIRTGLDTK
jgi:hypothetical protein